MILQYFESDHGPISMPRSARRRRSPRPLTSEPPALLAKLMPPNLGRDILPRPRLMEALERHAGAPLTLVIAEAGYGKTVLLASHVSRLKRPVIWYSLMPSDADPAVFGRHLLEGFRLGSPRFGRDFERALGDAASSPRWAETLGGILAHELSGLRGPARLLVLDDFHEVAGQPGVVTLVGTLLRYLPSSVRLVVAARSEPQLPLQRMRARGEVFELHSDHLRFTREELERLFGEVYARPLGGADLDALEGTTLGWPTAVRLVREALSDPRVDLRRVLGELKGPNLQLHEHLSAEVVAGLDVRDRALLECTAPLPRFELDLATFLSGHRDSRQRLEALTQQGLLRSFGEGDQTSYEVHELIRRHLRREMEARGGAPAWQEAVRRTADALRERGLDDRALAQYLAAGETETALEILGGLAAPLLRQGRAATLLTYFEALPLEAVRSRPALLVAMADAEQAVGRWDDAHAHYALALERCHQNPPTEEECRGVLGLAKVLQLRGRHDDVLEMVERFLDRSGPLPLELRVRLLQRKAGALYYLGRYEASVQLLDQVRGMLPATADPELLVPTVHNQAIAYAAQGRHREAAREFRAALSQVRGTSSARAPLYMANLALVLTYQGELGEARRVAEEGLAAARRFSNRAQETACLEVLALILSEGGDLDAALASVRSAEELNDDLRMDVLTADLLGLRGRIFCARGQYRRAVSFLTQAVQSLAARPDSPRRVEFGALLAWCELRAGRVSVAHDLLAQLVEPADRGGNDYERARVHYWLAEAELGLGALGQADAHLSLALRLIRERGYDHFLRVQAREDAAPLLHALARGLEIGTCAGALADAGGPVEGALIEILSTAPDAVAEAIASVLGEVGGPDARNHLAALSRTRPALEPALRRAIRNLDLRSARIRVDPERWPAPRLILFGPPRLEIGGRAIPGSAWRAQRAFQLLVYLALRPRGATRDELLECFWPGRQLAAGRRNFHPTLSYIRSVLPRAEAGVLLREGELYRLNPEYPLTCDLWEFEALLDASRAAGDKVARREALERALSLVTGPLLEGFYGNWADETSGRMRDRVETSLLALASLCMTAEDWADALERYRRAAELDPYREPTRVAIVECHVRLGNRRAALVEYDRLRGLLRAELSEDPLPETEEAMHRLLSRAGVDEESESVGA